MKLALLLPLVLLCACAFATGVERLDVPKDQADKCRAEGGCRLLTLQELAMLVQYIEQLERQGQTCRKGRYDI